MLWQEDHKKCGGQYQSPIQIIRHRAIPLYLRAVEMVGYHDPLPGPLNLTNNGHSGTVQQANKEVSCNARQRNYIALFPSIILHEIRGKYSSCLYTVNVHKD